MNLRLSAMALLLLFSAIQLCAEEPAHGDAGQQELATIRKLWKLSSEKTLSDQDQQYVASLMTVDWAGKRLSKWCYYALCKTNSNPEKYYDRFLTSLTFRYYNVVKGGEEAAITGTDPGNSEGPRLPDDLAQAEKKIWVFVVEGLWPRIVTARTIHFEHGAHAENQDPPEVFKAAGIPAPCAVPILAARLGDPKASVEERTWAAKAIGNLRRHAGSVEPLLKGFADSALEVRSACAEAMGELAHSFYLYVTYDREPKHPDAPRAVKALVALLQSDPESIVRIAAADGLATMEHEAQPAASEIAAIFEKENDSKVSGRILYTLCKLGDPSYDQFLIRALNKPDEEIKLAAIYSLGSLAGSYITEQNAAGRSKLAEAAVPALIKLLRDTPEPILEAAIQVLGSFDEDAAKALPELQRLLKNADGDLVRKLITTLGRIGPAAKDSVDLIVPWATKKELGFTVAISLGQIGKGGPAVERALLLLCESSISNVRREAAESMGHVGAYSEEALKKLASMAQSDPDTEVKESAATALSKLNDKKKAAEGF